MDGLTYSKRSRSREDGPGSHHDLRPRHHRNRRAATKLGAFDFIEKPLSLDKTLIVVKNAIEAHRLRSENKELQAASVHVESVIVGKASQ